MSSFQEQWSRIYRTHHISIMGAISTFPLIAVLAAISDQGVANSKKPIPVCKPPAPVCPLGERPFCSQSGDSKAEWVCKPAWLLQKVAFLLIPIGDVDLVHKKVVGDYMKKNPNIIKRDSTEWKMVKGEPEEKPILLDNKKVGNVMKAERQLSNNEETKVRRLETEKTNMKKETRSTAKTTEKSIGMRHDVRKVTTKLGIQNNVIMEKGKGLKRNENIEDVKTHLKLRTTKPETRQEGMINHRNKVKSISEAGDGKTVKRNKTLTSRDRMKLEPKELGMMNNGTMGKKVGLSDNRKMKNTNLKIGSVPHQEAKKTETIKKTEYETGKLKSRNKEHKEIPRRDL